MKKTTLFEKSFKNLFKSIPDIDFDEKELEIGIKTELEHTNNKKVAEIIAKHHLAEDPKYYSKLKKIHDEDENTVGGGALGPTAAAGYGTTVTGTPGTDAYAPGDYRIPKALGVIQTRNGAIKRKRRKKKNKK